MRTLGDQAKDFRDEKGWSPAQLARELSAVRGGKGEVSRQNIEWLEKNGNQLPKYIGDLAHLIGVTVDEMLAEAGLVENPQPPIERWPFKRLKLARVLALETDLAYLEGRLEEAVKDCEKRAKQAKLEDIATTARGLKPKSKDRKTG